MSKDKNIVGNIVMVGVLFSLVYIGINSFKGTRASYSMLYCEGSSETPQEICCPDGYYEDVSINDGGSGCVSASDGSVIDGYEPCTVEYDDNNEIIWTDCDFSDEEEYVPYINFNEPLIEDSENKIVGNVVVGTTIGKFMEYIDTNLSFSEPFVFGPSPDFEWLYNNDTLMTGAILSLRLNSFDPDYKISINGDVNGDGAITKEDIVIVSKYILGINDLDGVYLESADYDKDDKVNINDIIKMHRYIKNK